MSRPWNRELGWSQDITEALAAHESGRCCGGCESVPATVLPCRPWCRWLWVPVSPDTRSDSWWLGRPRSCCWEVTVPPGSRGNAEPSAAYHLHTHQPLSDSFEFIGAIQISLSIYLSIFILVLDGWLEQSLTLHSTQYRSFRRRSSQPITWLILTNKTVHKAGLSFSSIQVRSVCTLQTHPLESTKIEFCSVHVLWTHL